MSDLQSKQSLPEQPEINIGTIGHVDHGKTSLVKALTGVWASRHSEELRRGITIRLGYADAPIYKCPNCNAPECYTTKPICPNCKTKCEFLRAVSFVDAPGHEALMATMLSGAAIMDGALLVIAADEPCPQPQTREHLAAAEIVGLKNLVIVQNKIDLVDEKRALENYQEIINFVRGSVAEGAPIVPVSSQRDINIDVLIQTMEEYIPTPKRDPNLPPIMHVIRSFDINKPGTPAEDLVGGVLGGSISQGKFTVGEEIEIKPGIRVERSGGITYEPLFTEIVSLQAGGKKVKTAQCGGLIGVGTLLDPALTKADGLTGNLVGKPNQLPQTLSEFTLEMFLFKQVVGTKEFVDVAKIQLRELFLLDVGATITSGTVVSVKGDTVTYRLGRPVCAKEGSRVAVNRKIGGRWRLIGYGILV